MNEKGGYKEYLHINKNSFLQFQFNKTDGDGCILVAPNVMLPLANGAAMAAVIQDAVSVLQDKIHEQFKSAKKFQSITIILGSKVLSPAEMGQSVPGVSPDKLMKALRMYDIWERGSKGKDTEVENNLGFGFGFMNVGEEDTDISGDFTVPEEKISTNSLPGEKKDRHFDSQKGTTKL